MPAMGPKFTKGRPHIGGGTNSHHSSKTGPNAGPGAGPGADQSARKEPINSLDLSSFLSSLEQEVGDLHSAIKHSRDARVEKAFQRIPRSMRRRTASHNARRLPRRLRKQAHRDQAADNTPSIATGLAKRKKTRPASAWVYENTKKRIKLQEEKKLAAQGMGEDDEEMDVDDVGTDDDAEGGASLTAVPRTPLPIKNLRLPTHRWHAKRAQMDNPGYLWNSTIVRTSANKTYRMTLRASGLRPAMCVSWDTSYKATIYLRGTERNLDEALKSIVEPHLLTVALKQGACSVDAKLPRSFGYQHHQPGRADGCIGDSSSGEFSGPGNCGALTVFYNPTTTAASDDTEREAFVRVHPTIFSNVWTTLNREIMHKQLRVVMRDFRLEVGSIDVSGSAAVDALAATLYPYETSATPMEPLGKEFLKLRKMDTGGLSPASGAMLAFNIQDPRLDEPDDSEDKAGCGTGRIGRASALQAWPETDERRPSGLFNTQLRHNATKLPPLQVIDKRRGKLGAGEKLLVQPTSRPIPVIFAAGGSSSVPTEANPHAGSRNSTASSTWTLIAPRACIDAIWMRLHIYTLPSGHRSIIGGLEEEQHMALERGKPWFPADFPGTPTGWDWELQTRRGQEKEWNKKPTAKRTQWETVDLRNGTKGELGSGFACDWEYLFGADTIPATRLADALESESSTAGEQPATKRPANTDTSMDLCTGDDGTEKGSALEEKVQFAALRPGNDMSELVHGMQHASWSDIRVAVKSIRLQQPVTWRTPYQLMTISVQLLQGGVPGARARIYRLPEPEKNTTNGQFGVDGDLRAQWLALAGAGTGGAKYDKQPQPRRMPAGVDLDTRKRLLAQSLLETSLPYPRPAATGLYNTHHLALPGRDDLVGFVTSGAQRFQSGRGFGIGHASAQKLVESILAADTEAERKPDSKQVPIHRDARLCIVRNVGEEVGHLARWTPISN
ncbi:ribonuclease p complex subunit [Ophiostoma piceae UAMH 11346]|uniref:Ribonuclease p complex subunit n=1 Tax=Ophiostoma piceae (strain UAMH 11346) TaxID=1262450 RepID=S3BVE1_OPHP1|nr:ribonuclease p complex subunit [Ophiostoma piceae UAMH 11346]